MASDERDEGRWIAGEIEKQRQKGLSYNQVAVFYRTNAPVAACLKICCCAPACRIASSAARDSSIAPRSATSWPTLTLVVNPADDIAAKRVINTPRRGIGKSTVERIEQFAREMDMTFMEGC